MDQQQQDDLDVEFRKILCIIRHQIPYINSNAYLLQCRIWLEKLSTSNQDKVVRNVYLAELCKQMQANKLLPPFNEAPPKGTLQKLTELRDNFLQNCSSKDSSPEQKKLIPDNEPSFRHKVESWKTAEPFTTNEELIETPKVGEQSTDMSCGEPALKDKYLSTNESKSKAFDDDSWSDLSELSASSALNEDKSHVKEAADTNHHVDVQFADLKSTWIKPGLKFLKDTNHLSQDWKKTIGALQLRLSEMIQQNNQLNMVIQKLEIQLEEDKLNNKALNDHSLAISEKKHQQEITNLKQAHAEAVLHVEKSLEEEYEHKLKEVSRLFEEQRADVRAEHEDVLHRKDGEICRLSEIIHTQCLRIMNELATIKNQVSSCTCDKKVHVLKKCVSKMDKVFQRSEKEYLKQIEHLRQELELKDSALQVQLKIQKADLIAQTRTGQKEEFEEILNALEVKYIKMLEAHEQQIMKIKAQDDATIQHLSDLLLKHGIVYQENQ